VKVKVIKWTAKRVREMAKIAESISPKPVFKALALYLKKSDSLPKKVLKTL
jgi:hypothetical protein